VAPPKGLKRVTIDTAIDRYETWLRTKATYDQLRPATVAIYLTDLADFRARVGGDGILDDITAEDLQQLITQVARTPDRRFTSTAAPDQKRAQATSARWATSVRGLFKWSATQGFLQSDPWVDVHAPTHPKVTPASRRGPDVPTTRRLRDAPAVKAAASGVHSPAAGLQLRDRIIIHLLSETGPRVAELCGANREDLRDLNLSGAGDPNWQLFVTGKRGKSRDLPLSAQLVAMIDEYQTTARPAPRSGLPEAVRADSMRALLVSRSGRRLQPRDIQRLLAGYGAMLGRRVTPHTLRHTALSALAYGGAPIAAVRAIAGHSSVGTTSIYLDDDPQESQDALGKSPLGGQPQPR
jgi:integrase/recombinase XerD